MNPGDDVPTKTFPPIRLEQLKAYGKAAADPNPIHWDETIAKKAGLPGCIAHGMLVAALVAERAGEFAKQNGGWKLSSIRTRFSGMTLLGDEVSVQGKVASATDQEFAIDLTATNQKGDTLVKAVAHFTKS
jgi:acyl dehydratase